MIRNLLTFCLTIIVIISISAQGDTLITKSYYKDGYFKFKQNNLYGLATIDDKIILPIAFESLFIIADNLVKVENSNSEYGLITLQNDTLLPIENERINEFKDGYSVVYNDYKFGLINERGEVVIPFEYSYLSQYNGGVIAFRKDGNCGVMDINQNIIIATDKFKFINEFYDGFAVAKELSSEVSNANEGIINIKGEWVVEPRYTKIYRNSEGFKTIKKNASSVKKYSDEKSVTKCGYVDVKNDFVLEPLYDELIALDNGNFFVRADTFNYIINRSLDTLMTYNKGSVNAISNTHLKLYNSELKKYALVNSDGKFLSDFVYGTLSGRYNQFIYGRESNFLLLLGKNGEIIKKLANTRVLGSSKNHVILSNDFKMFVYDFDKQDFVFEKAIPKVKNAIFNGNEIYVEQKNNYAFFNLKSKQKTVLPYDVVLQANKDGILLVENDFKKGVITVDNEVVFEPKFSRIISTSDGILLTLQGYNDSLVAYNYNAEKLFSLPKDDVEYSKFSDGLLLSKNSTKYYYIDKTGKQVFESLFTCGDFHNDRAVFQGTYGLIGFYDKTGRKIIPASYKAFGNFSDNGLASVQFGAANLWGFINKKGEAVIDFQFDEVGSFVNGYAIVKKGDKLGYIDGLGDIIVPIEYDELKAFSEGLFGVKKNNLWGFIDTKGKLKIPFQFEEITLFSDNVCWVKKNGKIELINDKGQVKLTTDYNNIKNFKNGFAVAYNKENKYGVINKSGKIVVPFKNEYAIQVSDEYIILGNAAKWSVLKF